jgi:hypothetical protein
MPQINPFSNKPQGGPRLQVALQNIASEIQESLPALILDMDVRRIMIVIEHPYDDSEEDGDNGHRALFLSWQRRGEWGHSTWPDPDGDTIGWRDFLKSSTLCEESEPNPGDMSALCSQSSTRWLSPWSRS